MDESDSDSSQVFRPNIRRGVINYDEEHSIRVSPPTSGPTLEASTSRKIPSEESDNDVPDETEERDHGPEEEGEEKREEKRKKERVDVPEEEECDRSDTEALPSSLSNRTPPAKKRKPMASSSTAFLPEEKKTRERLSWSVLANFNSKDEYENSEIFNKLK